jgi:hypothetical protein
MAKQSTPSPAAAPPAPPPFVDNPNVGETFADGLQSVGIGSGFLTFTFAVTRTEDGKPPKLTRSPAARLVLTLAGALELHQKLTAVLTMLQQQGAAAAAAHAPASTPKVTQ